MDTELFTAIQANELATEQRKILIEEQIMSTLDKIKATAKEGKFELTLSEIYPFEETIERLEELGYTVILCDVNTYKIFWNDISTPTQEGDEGVDDDF